MAFWRKRYTSKHTGKEIDDAVDAVGSLPENIMSNPMTAAGDLIVGGEDGAAGKLAAGTSGQVLKIGTNGPEWASDAEGMVNPMTAQGDMIVGGNSGTPSRLAAPSNSGDILSNTSGVPVWSKMLPCYTANPASDPVIPSGQCAICIVSSEPSTGSQWSNMVYIITGI